MHSAVLRLRPLVQLLFVVLFLTSPKALWAQEGVKYGIHDQWQAGFNVGHFMPFGILGVIDQYAWTGVHMSHPSRLAHIEYAAQFGNGDGVKYQAYSLGLRTDYSAYDVIDGFISIGLTLHRYRRKANIIQEFDFVTLSGAHFGFGFTGHLGGILHGRAESKFFLGPGKSLYFGVGLFVRFGGDGAESSL